MASVYLLANILYIQHGYILVGLGFELGHRFKKHHTMQADGKCSVMFAQVMQKGTVQMLMILVEQLTEKIGSGNRICTLTHRYTGKSR